MITHEENSDRAQHFIRETIRQQGIEDEAQLTIHSDRGSPWSRGWSHGEPYVPATDISAQGLRLKTSV
jgi:transposase InsO family protein